MAAVSTGREMRGYILWFLPLFRNEPLHLYSLILHRSLTINPPTSELLLSIILTICGWIPGVLYAFYLIFALDSSKEVMMVPVQQVAAPPPMTAAAAV